MGKAAGVAELVGNSRTPYMVMGPGSRELDHKEDQNVTRKGGLPMTRCCWEGYTSQQFHNTPSPIASTETKSSDMDLGLSAHIQTMTVQ